MPFGVCLEKCIQSISSNVAGRAGSKVVSQSSLRTVAEPYRAYRNTFGAIEEEWKMSQIVFAITSSQYQAVETHISQSAYADALQLSH